MTSDIALDVTKLSKSYGAVRALHAVDVRVRFGEVRALLGKNGAGKSTFVNLVSGAERPDGGTIRLSGQEVHWQNPGEARDGGISVVHQELSLVPYLSVAENICLGRWERRGLRIDRNAMAERARKGIDALGVDLPLWTEVGRLSLAQQQLVEIAKAVAYDARVLILDEPTSALNAREVDELIDLVRRLAGSGMAVIYVSHRMQEIPRAADTMTVLRDWYDKSGIELIAGEAVTRNRQPESAELRAAPVVLSVEDLRTSRRLAGAATFDLHAGEVLGLAGVLGSGRSEILEAIFGITSPVSGRVRLRGKEIRRRTPARMLGLGVAMTPEDRKGGGIVAPRSVAENLMLSARGRTLPRYLIRSRTEAGLVRNAIGSLGIATSSPTKLISKLSGGNQQKAVIGRALACQPTVVLLDEPTRGVDLHAKSQIYDLIRSLAATGVAVVFVSSELDELPEVCDRVLIIRHGEITGEVDGSQATPERLLALTISGDNDDAR